MRVLNNQELVCFKVWIAISISITLTLPFQSYLKARIAARRRPDSAAGEENALLCLLTQPLTWKTLKSKRFETRPSKLCESQIFRLWEYLENVHPLKDITLENYSSLKTGRPWKIFTLEKYSSLKTSRPWRIFTPEKYSALIMHKIVSLSSQEDSQYHILNPWTPCFWI